MSQLTKLTKCTETTGGIERTAVSDTAVPVETSKQANTCHITYRVELSL